MAFFRNVIQHRIKKPLQKGDYFFFPVARITDELCTTLSRMGGGWTVIVFDWQLSMLYQFLASTSYNGWTVPLACMARGGKWHVLRCHGNAIMCLCKWVSLLPSKGKSDIFIADSVNCFCTGRSRSIWFLNFSSIFSSPYIFHYFSCLISVSLHSVQKN